MDQLFSKARRVQPAWLTKGVDSGVSMSKTNQRESKRMNGFDQIQAMKQALYEELADVLGNYSVHVGAGLCEEDVVGVIEEVKFDYQIKMADLSTKEGDI